MRLRLVTHSAYLCDRQRHPAPMLTANKPARRENYFKTGNVPQRCTAPRIRVTCFESHTRKFLSDARNREQGSREAGNWRAGKHRKNRERNSASRAAHREIPRRAKKTRNRKRLRVARAVPRNVLTPKKTQRRLRLADFLPFFAAFFLGAAFFFAAGFFLAFLGALFFAAFFGAFALGAAAGASSPSGSSSTMISSTSSTMSP